jgi:very-short-patch-repair endonuclease
VDWLDRQGLRLPDRAQVTVETAVARPDFVYDLDGGKVAVFVDGPHHAGDAQQQKDRAAEGRLRERGWDVVRFGENQAGWAAVAAGRPGVFGIANGAEA